MYRSSGGENEAEGLLDASAPKHYENNLMMVANQNHQRQHLHQFDLEVGKGMPENRHGFPM